MNEKLDEQIINVNPQITASPTQNQNLTIGLDENGVGAMLDRRLAPLLEKIDATQLHQALVEPEPKTAPVNNLPTEVDSFIGREREIEQIKSSFETNRLVTLTGPGGVGKSRLAREAARRIANHFIDGIWLVELATLNEPELVFQALTTILSIPEAASTNLDQGLVDYLEPKTLLLILDNCEHLISTCAHLCHELLSRCPSIYILTSSRERLDTQGEQLLAVPPLSIPDVDVLPSFEELVKIASIRLFVDRAVSVRPSFTINFENAAVVAQLCRRLDGIPLAVELTAVWVRAMSLEEIRIGLDDRFNLLTGGRQTAPSRHHTMMATLDWSYDLLTPREQQLFVQMSIFAGGWTWKAVEAVCSGENTRAEDIRGLLISLVDTSLVVHQLDDGKTRYEMLETIREYAQQKLQGTERDRTERNHADFYFNLSKTSANLNLLEDLSPSQKELLTSLWTERKNIQMALEWWQAHSIDPFVLLPLVWALFPYTPRHIDAGEISLDPSVAIKRNGRVWGNLWAAFVEMTANQALQKGTEDDCAVARSLFEQAAGFYYALDDKVKLVRALGGLMKIALKWGDNNHLLLLIELASAISVDTDDAVTRCSGLRMGASGSMLTREFDRVILLAGASDTLCRSLYHTFSSEEQSEYQIMIAQARSHLNVAAYEEAWQTGQAMSFQEAKAFMLLGFDWHVVDIGIGLYERLHQKAGTDVRTKDKYIVAPAIYTTG